MKKIISVLLAVIMMFSLVTVAFAAEEVNPGQDSTSSEDTTGGFNIEDMPLWQLKLILKGGKVVLSVAKVLFKLAVAFGLIDMADVLRTVIDFISNAQGGEPEDPSTDPSAEPVAPQPEEPVAA